MKGLSDYFPNGASEAQRENFMKGLLKGKPLYEAYKDWTVEEQCLDEQLTTLSMLDSCFAYGGVSKFYEKQTYNNCRSYYDEYLARYLEKGGSKEEYDKMLEIQKKHFEHCSVKYNVFTDGEGCTYNSIVDYDEVVV